jgi:prevent-host-death family protein
MQVAVRELKANLSRLLTRAQQGEVIEVTSHNKPVARIVGIPSCAAEGLGESISRGTISWRGTKPCLAPPLALAGHGPSVSQMVLEGRG